MWPFTSSGPSTSQQAPPAPVSAPSADGCPVDHETRAAWLQANPGAASPFASSSKSPNDVAQASRTFVNTASTTLQDSSAGPSRPTGPGPRRLSSERVVSSIPREFRNGSTPPPTESTAHSSSTTIDPSTESNWVYPSELQFFQAMLRKNHNPNAADMATIVPIHNAVNERAWAELLKWEKGQGGEKCGGVKLISFKGRPRDRTPKAWINTALGYTPPFDRHDWVISRCGQEIRYVIDFYTGRSPISTSGSSAGTTGLPSRDAGNLSFYLDVRPAIDGWEGARLRLSKVFGL